MRTSKELRTTSLVSFLVVLAFALGAALLMHLLLARAGRLGFSGWNLAGLLEGIVFLAVFCFGLITARRALNLPIDTLLSAGLISPITAAQAAKPVALSSDPARIDLSEMIAILLEDGKPVGLHDSRENRTISWEELAKIDGSVALNEVKSLLADHSFVVVVCSQQLFGLISREMFFPSKKKRKNSTVLNKKSVTQ